MFTFSCFEISGEFNKRKFEKYIPGLFQVKDNMINYKLAQMYVQKVK